MATTNMATLATGSQIRGPIINAVSSERRRVMCDEHPVVISGRILSVKKKIQTLRQCMHLS